MHSIDGSLTIDKLQNLMICKQHELPLDQNAISLQPTKFHAILTLLPQWPLLAPPLLFYAVTSDTPIAPRRRMLSILYQFST